MVRKSNMLARLKFEIHDLVNQILDGLPKTVWTNPSVTFCDPAMAGGQIISVIEQRLLAHGHSRDNVAGRVFGYENNKLRVTYARNKHGLIGRYEAVNISEEPINMKFDVIVGNPPFTNNHNSKRWTLWSKFVEHSVDKLSHDGSIIAMITPSSWLSPGKMFDQFMGYGLRVNLDASKHFNVGSTFSHWQLTKQQQSGDFEVVYEGNNYQIPRTSKWLPCLITAESLSINRKMFFSGLNRFKFKRTTEYHTSKKTRFSSKGQYRVFHTLAQELKTDHLAPHYEMSKAMITLSGYTQVMVDKNIGCSQAVAWLQIRDDQQDVARFVLNSKLYQYLLNINKWSGWNTLDVIKALPSVDLSRAWDDLQLYAHFGLTNAEIEFIEKTQGVV